MTRLFICEKPSQGRDIARVLGKTIKQNGYLQGDDFVVTWCLGHLLELAPPDYYVKNLKPWRIEVLPIIPRDWKMLVSQRGQKQFNVIKHLLKTIDHTVIASDSDRQGECLVKEILDYCHYQGTVERLWLNSLDTPSIKKALTDLRPAHKTDNLYYAALARMRSDYLIGMNMTMAASSLYGVNDVLSLGRVQTPTLKLVVDRDSQIANFMPKAYFVLKAKFTTKDHQSFWATWQANDNIVDAEGHCTDKGIVENIAVLVEEETALVTDYQQKSKQQSSPRCFSLSALQKIGSQLYGYGAKETLSIVQSLYETYKAITYPRTDCEYLPTAQFEDAIPIFSALKKIDPNLSNIIDKCDHHFQSSVWNDDKITAHHAIIPTLNTNVQVQQFSDAEYNIYQLICLRYVAQFLGDYHYQFSTIALTCAGEDFKATWHTPVTLGWKQSLMHKEAIEPNIAPNNEVTNGPLPKIQSGDQVDNTELLLSSATTKPPAHYIEGTLIEAMKNVAKHIDNNTLKHILKQSNGIGTEATRANILDILFKRGYLIRQAKSVKSTDKGRALLDIAPRQLQDPILTAQWEQKLDGIEQGLYDKDTFISQQIDLLNTLLAELVTQETIAKASVLQLQTSSHNGKAYFCPACNAPLRRLKNKKGHYFYGCSTYPTCAFTTWERNNKPCL